MTLPVLCRGVSSLRLLISDSQYPLITLGTGPPAENPKDQPTQIYFYPPVFGDPWKPPAKPDPRQKVEFWSFWAQNVRNLPKNIEVAIVYSINLDTDQPSARQLVSMTSKRLFKFWCFKCVQLRRRIGDSWGDILSFNTSLHSVLRNEGVGPSRSSEAILKIFKQAVVECDSIRFGVSE